MRSVAWRQRLLAVPASVVVLASLLGPGGAIAADDPPSASWNEPVPGARIETEWPRDANQVVVADVAGVPHVLWTESDNTEQRAWVRRLDAELGQWTLLTGTASVEMPDWTAALRPDLAGLGTTPLVSVIRRVPGMLGQLVVMEPNEEGTGWQPLTAEPINIGWQIGDTPSLAVGDGTPWVAWTESHDGDGQIFVRHLSADGSSWVDPAPGVAIGDPEMDNEQPQMIVAGGIPYVTWIEKPDYFTFAHATVRVARLTNGSWELLGAPLLWDASGTRHAQSPSVALHGPTPFVAWVEGSPQTDDYDVRVARWDDVQRTWAHDGPLNGNLCFQGDDCTVELGAVGSQLYAAFGGNGVFVKRLDADGTWTEPAPGRLDLPPGSGAQHPTLSGVGSTPYVAYLRFGDGTEVKRLDESPAPPELDITPPSGTITVEGGASHTADDQVTLTLTADQADVTHVALSNDGLSWSISASQAAVAWSIPASDGPHAVTARWRDQAGHWSAPSTDSITLDRAPPTGSITIAAGATDTRSRAVTVSVPASDATSGVSQVALSNDGVSWTLRPYAASTAWTLAASLRTATVWAKWQDHAGNWSAPTKDAITLDTAGPRVSPPSVSLTQGALPPSGIGSAVRWTAGDATSGVVRYELAQSTDGGPFVTVASTLVQPSLGRVLATGHEYRFRVRAFDRAGNASAWVSGPVVTADAVAESPPAVASHGTWTVLSDPAFVGGSARRSSGAGASVTYSFTGRSIAWVASRGPTLGRVSVIVDGTTVATVDLYGPAVAHRQIVFSRAWSSSGPHSITLVNQATPGRPGVLVDGFLRLT